MNIISETGEKPEYWKYYRFSYKIGKKIFNEHINYQYFIKNFATLENSNSSSHICIVSNLTQKTKS